MQDAHNERYERTIGWLGAPFVMPVDSFGADIDSVFTDNRTLFLRRSSWNTMVAAGQLIFLDDPALVARLANLYENLDSRLEYNGSRYDDAMEDVARNAAPSAWDRVESGLLTRDPAEIKRFRGQLDYLHDWNQYYLDLLSQWRKELDDLIEAVGEYLEAGGA